MIFDVKRGRAIVCMNVAFRQHEGEAENEEAKKPYPRHTYRSVGEWELSIVVTWDKLTTIDCF